MQISPVAKTIVEAIKIALRDSNQPMSFREVYGVIVEQNLYEFHAEHPAQVVQAQIRRHCVGLDFPSAKARKWFVMSEPGRYTLIPEDASNEIVADDKSLNITQDKGPRTAHLPGHFYTQDIKRIIETHTSWMREAIVNDLKKLLPSRFEQFSRKLLTAYGFQDVQVTQVSRGRRLRTRQH